MNRFQRWVHAAAVLVAALLIALAAAHRVACFALRDGWSAVAVAWCGGGAGVVLVGAAVIARRRQLAHRWLVPLIVVLAAWLIFLAWDEPRVPKFDPGPIVAETDPSFLAYSVLLKSGPHSRIAEWPAELNDLRPAPNDQTEWPKFFAENRATYERAWEKNTVGRAWVDGLAAHAPTGSFPLVDFEGPLLDFRSVRTTTRLAWYHAYFLARDGNADAAAKSLTTLLRASYHLERGGSTLVTEMIANVCVRGTMEQLDHLVAGGTLSPDARREAAAVLREAVSPAEVFRNASIGEQQYGRSWLVNATRSPARATQALGHIDEVEGAAVIFGLPVANRLLLNRNRDERRTFANYAELQHAVEQRQLDRLKDMSGGVVVHHWHWKDPLGKWLYERGAPQLAKVASTLLDTEDRRVALLKKFEAQ